MYNKRYTIYIIDKQNRQPHIYYLEVVHFLLSFWIDWLADRVLPLGVWYRASTLYSSMLIWIEQFFDVHDKIGSISGVVVV